MTQDRSDRHRKSARRLDQALELDLLVALVNDPLDAGLDRAHANAKLSAYLVDRKVRPVSSVTQQAKRAGNAGHRAVRRGGQEGAELVQQRLGAVIKVHAEAKVLGDLENPAEHVLEAVAAGVLGQEPGYLEPEGVELLLGNLRDLQQRFLVYRQVGKPQAKEDGEGHELFRAAELGAWLERRAKLSKPGKGDLLVRRGQPKRFEDPSRFPARPRLDRRSRVLDGLKPLEGVELSGALGMPSLSPRAERGAPAYRVLNFSLVVRKARGEHGSLAHEPAIRADLAPLVSDQACGTALLALIGIKGIEPGGIDPSWLGHFFDRDVSFLKR